MKKTDYDTKISEIQNKYITSADYNRFTKIIVDNSIRFKNLGTDTYFNAKLQENKNKTKHLIAENDFKKLQKFDSSYFRGKNYFDDDGTQNYLVFQPKEKYFKTTDVVNNEISSWKSKGLPDEEIKSFTSSGISTAPKLS